MRLPFFQRSDEAMDISESSTTASERMAREIKGCIFALFALFELVALTSYIPIDSFNLFQGRLDHMNNLGGIVGAIVSEWFLGTVGIAGYAIVLLTLWFSVSAFRGRPLTESVLKMAGTLLGALLGAVTCHLLFSTRFPEASLMQGGVVGKTGGAALQLYFNTTGALLLVGGGFVITFILTSGLSISGAVEKLFEGAEEDEEGDDRDEDEATPAPRPVHSVAEAPATVSEPKKPARSRRKKAQAEAGDGGANGEAAEAAPAEDVGFQEIIPFPGVVSLPSTRLLKGDIGDARKLSRGEVKENSRKLVEHLLSFQITGEITHVNQGPVLTTYEYKPAAGVKLSKIANLQDDLGVVLGAQNVRVVAPIPGKTVVGIEVPRPKVETIPLKDVLNDKSFYDKKIRIPVALGKSTEGAPLIGDLAAMPHLLVAGSTGSGKSVFMNSLIMSFLYRLSPQQLRLILVDPKMLEFSIFQGLPHLITDVITKPAVAINALAWAVEEMERRYALMATSNSKNIDSYNSKKSGNAKLPYIVIVVDELADLMMSGGEFAEISITRIAQKARAAGIHMVLATQRPSTDIVTGLIKANIPSRIAFKVPSAIDSRTVLDGSGAEALIGRGDSLLILSGQPVRRVHGCFVTEDELARVVNYVKNGRKQIKHYIHFSEKMKSE